MIQTGRRVSVLIRKDLGFRGFKNYLEMAKKIKTA
jgi:hypothetical protein